MVDHSAPCSEYGRFCIRISVRRPAVLRLPLVFAISTGTLKYPDPLPRTFLLMCHSHNYPTGLYSISYVAELLRNRRIVQKITEPINNAFKNIYIVVFWVMILCSVVADVSKEPVFLRLQIKKSSDSSETVASSFHFTQFCSTEYRDSDLHCLYNLKSCIL